MKTVSYLLAVLYVLILPCKSYSQFYKIYGYLTPEAGEKEIVYWLSQIPSSDCSYSFFGKNVGRSGLFAHSAEIEYGLSNRFGIAMYFDFEKPKGEELRFIRTKAVVARYRFYEPYSRPIDLALYVEYKLPKKEYENKEELELKVIMEKNVGFHTLILNPTFEKAMSGVGVMEGVEFTFNCGYYYKESLTVQPGIEFYGKFGELRELEYFDKQKNYIFPTIDFFFGKKLNVNLHLGLGFGITESSDNVILKSILSYGFF